MINTVIYAWYNHDWGKWFYVGIGTPQRAKSRNDRNSLFKEVVDAYRCTSHILGEFPSDWEENEKEEIESKLKRILKLVGEPIIDYEPSGHYREARLKGIEIAKAAGKYKGRQFKPYDKKLFEKQYKKWKNGEVTAVSVMRALDLKPNTFYRRVRDYEIEKGIRKE